MRKTFYNAVFALLSGAVAVVSVAWSSAAWVDLEPMAVARITPTEYTGKGFRTITRQRLSRLRIACVASSEEDDDRMSNFLADILPEDEYASGPLDESLPPSWEAVLDRTAKVSLVVMYAQLQYSMVVDEAAQSDQLSVDLPGWYERDIGYDEAQQAFWMIQIDDAHGWPFLALRSRLRLAPVAAREGNQADQLEYGIQLPLGRETTYDFWSASPPWPNAPWSGWRALPLRPIWAGFVADVLFWAVTLWAVVVGPFEMRQHLRKHRGRCPQCAYNLRGDLSQGCPECGWGREEKLSSE